MKWGNLQPQQQLKNRKAAASNRQPESTPWELQPNTVPIPKHHPLRNSANATTVSPHRRHCSTPQLPSPESARYWTQAHHWPNFPPLSPPANTKFSLFLLEWWHPQHQDWTLALSSVKEQIPPHQNAASKQVSMTQYTDKTYLTQVNRNLTFISLCSIHIFPLMALKS